MSMSAQILAAAEISAIAAVDATIADTVIVQRWDALPI